MPYRRRPEPQEIATRAQAICKRIDRASLIWFPLFLLASCTIDGASTVFKWTMISRLFIWPLLGVNPITGKYFRVEFRLNRDPSLPFRVEVRLSRGPETHS